MLVLSWALAVSHTRMEMRAGSVPLVARGVTAHFFVRRHSTYAALPQRWPLQLAEWHASGRPISTTQGSRHARGGVCGEVSGMPRRILQVPLACFMTSTPRCAALSQFARLQQANNDAAGGTSIGSQDKHEAQRRHAGLAVDMCRRATCRRGVPCGHMPATGIGAPCGHYLDAPAPPWGDF